LSTFLALADHEGIDESKSDITTLVVVHTVTVKIATDEEWRSYYGANAVTVANNALEAADDAMYTKFGIDLYHYLNKNWDSSPDSGVDACDLLDDLKADASPGSADILIGFAKNNSTNYSGCAENGGDEAEVNWASLHQDRWVTLQHEVSHLFGAPDRYPDPYGTHNDDVMENQYNDFNKWCTYVPVGLNDHEWLEAYAGKYD
jgi:hypothetical protein